MYTMRPQSFLLPLARSRGLRALSKEIAEPKLEGAWAQQLPRTGKSPAIHEHYYHYRTVT